MRTIINLFTLHPVGEATRLIREHNDYYTQDEDDKKIGRDECDDVVKASESKLGTQYE